MRHGGGAFLDLEVQHESVAAVTYALELRAHGLGLSVDEGNVIERAASRGPRAEGAHGLVGHDDIRHVHGAEAVRVVRVYARSYPEPLVSPWGRPRWGSGQS